jgi:hypothetical protein
LTVVVAMAGPLTVATAPSAQAAPGTLEYQFLSLLNGDRASNGLPPLTITTAFSDIAEGWSLQMASTSVLSHNPNLVAQVAAVVPDWQALGENVGFGPDPITLQNAFMASPPHRANILNPGYNYVGIGAVTVNGRIWVTFDFVRSPSLLLPAPGPVFSVTLVRTDGTITSAPAVAGLRGSSHLDVVARGTDGSIYWTASNGGAFTSWTSLGAPPVGMTGDPTSLSSTPGRIDIFVRGGDSRLWQRFTDNRGANWSSWFQPLGTDGVLASAPMATSWGSGRLDVVVVGTDGHLYQRYWEGGWSAAWLDLGFPSAGISGDPAAVGWAPGRLDLFVRGTDNRLWQRFWAGSGWSAWFQPVGNVGVLASSPTAASEMAGELTVLTRGSDNGVYELQFDLGWSNWNRVGAASDLIRGRPYASAGPTGIVAVTRGTDNRAYLFANV